MPYTLVYKCFILYSDWTKFHRELVTLIPSIHKFGMFYILVHRCFALWSDWTKFLRELMALKEIFQRNSYPTSFINKCFKKFFKRFHITKPTFETVKRKALRLVLAYLGSMKAKTRNALKDILHCCYTSGYL